MKRTSPYKPKFKVILHSNYQNHLNEIRAYETEFLSIDELGNYFNWHPDQAMMVGIIEPDAELVGNSRHSRLHLSISYYEGIQEKEVHFHNAQELYRFIKENATILNVMNVPIKDPKNVTLHIEWEDFGGPSKKSFNTVQELAEFLKQHYEIARQVNYVPKRK